MTLFGMFAKYWESGKVKTRLAASIGPDLARDVYFLFLQHLVRKFSDSFQQRQLAYSPMERLEEFEKLVGDSWELQPQADGDLGNRMSHFFETNLSKADKVILVGSDTPDLSSTIAEQAAHFLGEHDVVLGPSLDGGYYLIGMRKYCAELFDGVPWSTPQVLETTISKLKESDTSFAMLPEKRDVDEGNDLLRLMNALP